MAAPRVILMIDVCFLTEDTFVYPWRCSLAILTTANSARLSVMAMISGYRKEKFRKILASNLTRSVNDIIRDLERSGYGSERRVYSRLSRNKKASVVKSDVILSIIALKSSTCHRTFDQTVSTNSQIWRSSHTNVQSVLKASIIVFPVRKELILSRNASPRCWKASLLIQHQFPSGRLLRGFLSSRTQDWS